MPVELLAAIDLATPTASAPLLNIPASSGRDILHVPKR